MQDKFHIHFDAARAMVRIRIAGFFNLVDVEAFALSRHRVYADLATRRGDHLTLCDVSDCKIQSQEVFAAFRTLLEDQRTLSRRIAFVIGRSPARLQLRRLLTRDTAQAFDDMPAAERWLAAADPAGGA